MFRRFTLSTFSRTATSARLGAAALPVAAARCNADASEAARASQLARDVNKLKRAHQSAAAADRKKMEAEAWQQLNTLTEAEINATDGQAVALVLNAWAYFAKFWEHGQDGPIGPSDPLHGGQKS